MNGPRTHTKKRRLKPRVSEVNDDQNFPTKELDLTGSKIKHLPAKTTGKELTINQLDFDLGVHVQTELDGIGMGVLTDETP
jgi:hypothetical protein